MSSPPSAEERVVVLNNIVRNAIEQTRRIIQRVFAHDEQPVTKLYRGA
jgi:hypothetical protein